MGSLYKKFAREYGILKSGFDFKYEEAKLPDLKDWLNISSAFRDLRLRQTSVFFRKNLGVKVKTRKFSCFG